ncbi:cysteine-rich KTR domain-containing protein [Tissierella carlieri]|nr:cysteine-rich KTR domain-containing protein [Tissierella carlieri]
MISPICENNTRLKIRAYTEIKKSPLYRK